MRQIISVLLLVVACAPVQAGDVLSPTELVFAERELIGEMVVLDGCRWRHASASRIVCDAYVDGEHIAFIEAMLKGVAPADIKAVVQLCNGFEKRERCAFRVAGVVQAVGPSPRLWPVVFDVPR